MPYSLIQVDNLIINDKTSSKCLRWDCSWLLHLCKTQITLQLPFCMFLFSLSFLTPFSDGKDFCICFVFRYLRRVWPVLGLLSWTHWKMFKLMFSRLIFKNWDLMMWDDVPLQIRLHCPSYTFIGKVTCSCQVMSWKTGKKLGVILIKLIKNLAIK